MSASDATSPATSLPRRSFAENEFWADVNRRLDEASAAISTERMVFEEGNGWTQESVADLATLPVPLQNRFMAVDVTDHGLGIYPLQLGGRYYVRVGFSGRAGDRSWSTHPEDSSAVDRRMVVRPGVAILEGTFGEHARFSVETTLSPSSPLILVTLSVDGDWTGPLSVRPELWWAPGERDPNERRFSWLRPAQQPLADEGISHNNSRIPDPPRPSSVPPAGIGVTGLGALPGEPSASEVPLDGDFVLVDSLRTGGGLQRLELPGWSVDKPDGRRSFTLLLGATETAEEFFELVRRWGSSDGAYRERERGYWGSVGSRLSVSVPDEGIRRQARYSVHNSLFSRSTTSGGRGVFLHGRRDRGYADCAHLHQSYMMHLAALAAGEGDSVRDELLAFAALQDCRGDLARAPRPGHGWHPYVGLYTNAHFLLALHRYLAWTGDREILKELVTSLVAEDGPRTVLDRARLAASFLLANMEEGVLRPCGWLDAWPPRVRAQAQISAAVFMGLSALAEVCRSAGDLAGAEEYETAARSLARRIQEVFYDGSTGLYAEHLFDGGRVVGGTPEDFWVHTQVWAALAGLAPDVRGLEAARRRCLSRGMRIVPESSFEQDYVADSTDGAESLDVGSTATWLLASWPELTHLYATAEIRYGRPDAALEAIAGQLPERLHPSNPRRAAPYYYAEKYLYPGDRPWLCTWAGDPTLLETLLTGFLGVRPGLDGLWVRPAVPSAWRGRRLRASFCWLGARWELLVDPEQPPDRLTVDGRDLAADAPISTALARSGAEHVVKVSPGYRNRC